MQLRSFNGTLLDFDAFAARSYKDSTSLDTILNGDVHDDVLVDSFLWQARPALVPLDGILALPHFELVDIQTLNHRSPEALVAMSVVQVLRLSALRAQANSDFLAAANDVARSRRLATRYCEDDTDLLHFLTAASLNDQAAAAARDLLNNSASTFACRALVAHAWTDSFSWSTALQRATCGEYRNTVYVVNNLPALIQAEAKTHDSMADMPKELQDLGVRLVLQRNRTRREFAELMHRIQASLHGPYSQLDPLLRENGPRKEFNPMHNGGSNLLGQLLISTADTIWPRALATAYTQTAADRLIQISLAARNYFDDHHTLPPTLADLVPEYLPAVPLDPFDDKPLRYDAAKGLIYSVGTDLKDQGGSRFLTMPHAAREYMDPLADNQQPTLALRFQKSTTAATP
jgi:hypothetical protein